MLRRDHNAYEAASPEAVTELILRIFRVNGRLLQAGDQLVGAMGLTSARWQLLGAIAAAADRPKPVVGLARDMGVSRQAVQRIANDLARAELVVFTINPHHKKAQLVEFTNKGRSLFEQAMRLQRPWAIDLAEGLTGSQVEAACGVLNVLLNRFDRRKGSAADQD